jgi:hypothetical protein
LFIQLISGGIIKRIDDMDIPTNKKRKLNSKNPKYQKKNKDDIKVDKRFVQEVNGVKVYTIHS